MTKPTVQERASTLTNQALKEAQAFGVKTIAAKGHSVRFAKAVVLLAGLDLSIEERGNALKGLTDELEKIESIGKGYASNARRVFAAKPEAIKELTEHCEDPANGWKALTTVFSSKGFKDKFPALSATGRAAKTETEPMVKSELRLDQRDGALVALREIQAATVKLVPIGPTMDRFESALAEAIASLQSIKPQA